MNVLGQLLGLKGEERGSGAIAKERLKLVLECDRAQLTAAELDEIRDEIVDVISRHVNIRREDVEVKLERGGGRLVADIPLDRYSRRPVHRERHR